MAVLNLERRQVVPASTQPASTQPASPQPAQADEPGDFRAGRVELVRVELARGRGRYLSDDRDTSRHNFGNRTDSVTEAVSTTRRDGRPDRDDKDDGDDDIIEVPWPRRPEASSSSIDSAAVNPAFQDESNI